MLYLVFVGGPGIIVISEAVMTLACPLAAEESATARIFELVCLRAFQRWIVLQVCTWYLELILLT